MLLGEVPGWRKAMIAYGIDQSTTATGLVVLRGTIKEPPVILLNETFKPKKVEGMERVSAILGRILAVRDEFKPDVMAIENYGLNMRNKTSVIPLVTLGAIIRYYFEQEKIPYLAPTPSEHKRFITGNGNTPKDKIPSFVRSVWDFDAPDGDQADAYGLAAIALGSRNALFDMNLTMREVAYGLKSN
jgi:crossover junction endodeoxyribonuclease RuvC